MILPTWQATFLFFLLVIFFYLLPPFFSFLLPLFGKRQHWQQQLTLSLPTSWHSYRRYGFLTALPNGSHSCRPPLAPMFSKLELLHQLSPLLRSTGASAFGGRRHHSRCLLLSVLLVSLRIPPACHRCYRYLRLQSAHLAVEEEEKRRREKMGQKGIFAMLSSTWHNTQVKPYSDETLGQDDTINDVQGPRCTLCKFVDLGEISLQVEGPLVPFTCHKQSLLTQLNYGGV